MDIDKHLIESRTMSQIVLIFGGAILGAVVSGFLIFLPMTEMLQEATMKEVEGNIYEQTWPCRRSELAEIAPVELSTLNITLIVDCYKTANLTK